VRLAAVAVVLSCIGCRAASSSAPPIRGVRDVPVTFRSGGATLAGTLFLPDGADGGGRHPAVVLFHGSGPQARDSFTGRWFAEHGIVSLAYDKRGVGDSSGDFRAVPFTDLVDDGLAGLALLKARADVDPGRIGVWGLSQGGWLGPLAASKSKDIAFVIAISGPGVSPGEQMVFYYGSQLHERGFSDREVDEAGDVRRKVWHLLSTGEDYDAAAAALDRAKARPWFDAINEQSNDLFRRSASELRDDRTLRDDDWFRAEIDYDPRIALRALSVPALFVFGDRDALVPVDRSVSIIRETMTHPGHPPFAIVVFPGADHGIFVKTAEGRRALAPGYLDTVADWLRRTVDLAH